MKMKIVFIDDHKLLVQSLASMIRRYDFIGSIETFHTPKEFLLSPAAQDPGPDIIISDILMPEMSGMELLTQYKKENKKVKIILLSSIIEVQTVRHAMRTGASGYLSKDSPIEELAEALQTVYHGGEYIGESLRKIIVRNSFSDDQFVYQLSPREKEVLNWVCSGKTIKEAAQEMNLSVNTVQSYYKTILKKFNLNRTSDLIVFAIQNGLYNPSQKS